MNFKKEFPSLDTITFIGHLIPKNGKESSFIPKIDVEKHCLDKQRVRDAIEKVFSKGPRSWRATKRHIELKKELGL